MAQKIHHGRGVGNISQRHIWSHGCGKHFHDVNIRDFGCICLLFLLFFLGYVDDKVQDLLVLSPVYLQLRLELFNLGGLRVNGFQRAIDHSRLKAEISIHSLRCYFVWNATNLFGLRVHEQTQLAFLVSRELGFHLSESASGAC